MATLPELTHQATDMGWMVADAKRLFNHHRDAFGRPYSTNEPKRFCPTGEQQGELLPVRLAQLWLATRVGCGPHGVTSTTCTGQRDPLADRTRRARARGGNVSLFPALLSEVKGTQPAAFCPVVRAFCG